MHVSTDGQEQARDEKREMWVAGKHRVQVPEKGAGTKVFFKKSGCLLRLRGVTRTQGICAVIGAHLPCACRRCVQEQKRRSLRIQSKRRRLQPAASAAVGARPEDRRNEVGGELPSAC
eukprot:6187226-Pleurochrysis_carterae.AAC.1